MGRVLPAGELPAGYSCWQAESGYLWVVLGEVFAWLSGRELAASGAVCRAWRAAAGRSGLWRRLLRAAGVADATLRALREHCPSLSWRQEYIDVCASWKLVRRLPPETESEENAATGDKPPLAHAALDDTGTRLALAAADGAFSIWERSNDNWSEEWSTDLRTCGWLGAVRAEWAAARGETGHDAPRLLVTGALALADRWELLVLRRDDFGEYRREARAGCSSGAGGCWAGADAFLSLELARLAPRLAVTVVWLNAATQETQSEYTGVTTPLLRVFNEDSAHLTHALVADVPLEALEITSSVADDEQTSLGFNYYSMRSQRISEESVQTLVTASHGAGGALRSWAVRARRPPPLCAAAAGSLAARARRRRRTASEPPLDPREPDEATVRAMCDPPDAVCYLQAAVLGLVLQYSKKCVWAATADGQAWCVSLPALARLCRLAGAAGPPAAPHYAQPAAARYVAACGARVRLWSALSGAPCPRPPTLPRASSPALVCLLPPLRDELFVLAGQSVYIWRSHATPQPANGTIEEHVT